MKVLEIIDRAKALRDGLPERVVSPGVMKAYRREFVRMWRETDFDPLRPGDARDTYGFRRAALPTVSRFVLTEAIERCLSAGRANDLDAVQATAAVLLHLLERIEPALRRDPPLAPDGPSFSSPPSRWHDTGGPRRGQESKKHVLGHLPKDWTDRLWAGVPDDWAHRAVLAVHLLCPARAADFVPGKRPHGWSDGIVVELPCPKLLTIEIAPVKSHNGMYGTPTTKIMIDPVTAAAPAAYLAELCRADGGRTIVSIESADGWRKSLARQAKHVLPDTSEVITPGLLRHQAIADLKATVGAGETVASAAGHCSDRTQARYGRVEHGRRRRGFLGAKSSRPPRTGNVARASELKARRRKPKPDDGS